MTIAGIPLPGMGLDAAVCVFGDLVEILNRRKRLHIQRGFPVACFLLPAATFQTRTSTGCRNFFGRCLLSSIGGDWFSNDGPGTAMAS